MCKNNEWMEDGGWMEEPSTETTEDNRQTNLKLNKRRLVPFRTRKSVRTNLMVETVTRQTIEKVVGRKEFKYSTI
jgi:hypothetical protein